jgi:2-polyprenyl-3-methyl-5-hydroxy-6-metoxy-1,4-benzoquinol methylase
LELIYKPGVDYLIKKGFNVIHADACDFDLGEKFDTIVCGDIIEHLEDFNGFIECCKNHMNENSRLIISTPNPWYWRNTIKAAIGKEVDNNPEHTCWLCPRTLRQLLNRHDIQIEEIAFGSRYARDLLLPLPKGWKHTSFHAICKNK